MNPFHPWNPVTHHAPMFVLDTSLPLEWYTKRMMSRYANDVFLKTAQSTVVVPTLWSNQLTEFLLLQLRGARLTIRQVEACITGVLHFAIVIDNEGPARAWSDYL